MAEQNELAPVYIMGKRYEVPSNLTIMKAMEYAGYQLIRGVGCRGGFCGACATVYRVYPDYRLKIGLACQTVVQPDMYLAQIPFFPGRRATYRLQDLKPTFETVVQLYPEVLRCLACGTCTKSCPQDLKVKDYMADAMRGNIAARGRQVVRLPDVRAVHGALSGRGSAVQRRDPVPAPVRALHRPGCGAPGPARRRDRRRPVRCGVGGSEGFERFGAPAAVQ